MAILQLRVYVAAIYNNRIIILNNLEHQTKNIFCENLNRRLKILGVNLKKMTITEKCLYDGSISYIILFFSLIPLTG